MDKVSSKNVILSFLKTEDKYYYEKQAMDFTSIAPIIEPGKPLSDRELLRSLRLAIAAEEDAASLYELIADSTENKVVEGILNDIAGEEKVHVGELQKILAMLDKDEEGFLNEGKKEVEEKIK